MKNFVFKPSVFFLNIILLFSFLSAKNDELKQQLVDQIKAFYGVDSIAPRHQSDFAFKLALREIYDQLPAQLQEAAKAQMYTEIPVRQVAIQSPSGHFTLHYDTTQSLVDTLKDHSVPLEDISGNGIPDYIDSAAVFLDHVWQVEIDELGFSPPLNQNGQTASPYQIYFSNIDDYGVTQPQDEINDNRPNNYTSYIELHNTMQAGFINTKGLDGLRVTCAHEFNHAIQISYRYRFLDIYFYEMTSTWLEDIVYPDVNDYFYYLDGFIQNAQNISFTSTFSVYEYANCLYVHMLSRMYGNHIIVEVWQQIIQDEVLDALEKVLNKYQTSFPQSLNNYAKWLYFTGVRTIPGEFFTDAAYFKMITIPSSAHLESDIIVNHGFQIYPLSFYYLKIDSITSSDAFINVESEINNHQIQVNYFNSEKYNTNPSEADANLPVQIESVPQDLVFVVSNSTNSFAPINFTFFTDSSIVPREEGSPVAYGPNPTNIGRGVKSANFWSVPAFAKIIIMDLNQQPVRELNNDDSSEKKVIWDLKDKNGNLVSSGIYFYIVIDQGKTQIDKIAIIR